MMLGVSAVAVSSGLTAVSIRNFLKINDRVKRNKRRKAEQRKRQKRQEFIQDFKNWSGMYGKRTVAELIKSSNESDYYIKSYINQGELLHIDEGSGIDEAIELHTVYVMDKDGKSYRLGTYTDRETAERHINNAFKIKKSFIKE